MRFKSLADMALDIRRNLLPTLPRDVGSVYGIPRSGLLPASIIATMLGVPLWTPDRCSYVGERGKLFQCTKNNKLLIVDDTIRSGSTMRKEIAQLAIVGQMPPYYTCAIYVTPESKYLVDFHAEVVDLPRMFEWNFSGIKSTIHSCWDLDGAICTDPSVFDDDGEAYRLDILSGVRPLLLPQVEVLAVITNRLERWRIETETWLKNHNVKYKNLIMQPFATAGERRMSSKPSEYKARWLEKLDGKFFVESDDKQARRIAELTGRPVLSIETMQLY